MQKLLVVNARFLTQQVTGVQRYAIEISKELYKYYKNDIIFVSHRGVLDLELYEELNVIIVGINKGHLWEQIDLPFFLKKQGKPILLNLANTAPLFYHKKISTIHDIAFEIYPEMFSKLFLYYYKFLIPRIFKSSMKILTVSNFSKKEIMKYYGHMREHDIHVVYNGVNDIFEKSSDSKKKYILSVSSLNKRKNFKNLINAFIKLNETNLKLYLIGDINRNFADQKILDMIDSNDNIIFLGRVTDNELIKLYSEAEAFVFPSIYEGFGIPPLEAQSCGCPVILSNAASLPEVCEQSAYYFNAYDVNDICSKMKEVISDEELKNDLVNKGYENIKRFSWMKSAMRIIEILEELK